MCADKYKVSTRLHAEELEHAPRISGVIDDEIHSR
jgi:hypothetical protein